MRTALPFLPARQGRVSVSPDPDSLPGEYSVSLEEAEGYRVPNTITSIQVKQEIEYRVLDDIEYLIHFVDCLCKEVDTHRNVRIDRPFDIPLIHRIQNQRPA